MNPELDKSKSWMTQEEDESGAGRIRRRINQGLENQEQDESGAG
jgi:hypothetical protein